MKTLKVLFFLFFLVSNIYGQSVLQSGKINIATLILDYDDYTFEKGNFSSYETNKNIGTKIEFLYDYYSPCDNGDISMYIKQTNKRFFSASIIWMGTGNIYYPSSYVKNIYPFTTNDTTIKKPDLNFINKTIKPFYVTNSVFLSINDNIWNSIKSLYITTEFSNYNYNVDVYLYSPQEGPRDYTKDKWIVILSYNDYNNIISLSNKSISTEYNNVESSTIEFFNQSNNIYLKNITEAYNYQIIDTNGRCIVSGIIENNDINISSLKPNLYILKIIGINKVFKFIKK